MVTWKKRSILVVAVVLDPRLFKFVLVKGLKKTSPSNLSKSGIFTKDINCQKVLEG